MADAKGHNDTTTQQDIEKNKTMAILAYFIFFIPLLTDAKDSKSSFSRMVTSSCKLVPNSNIFWCNYWLTA